jgi:DNA-binding CsgD family transcriptional regulator
MRTEAAFADEEWQVSSEPIADAGLRADLEAVMVRVAEHGGRDLDGRPAVDDIASAEARLRSATEHLLAELRGGRRAVPRDVAVDLLLDLRTLGDRLVLERDAARSAAFGRVRDGMGLLRGVTTVEQMLERAPMAATRLGFDRTIVSAVKDSCFVPRTCFIGGDTEWAQAIVRAGAERPRRLDRNLLETEMVRRRQPIRVQDAQNDPRVHREIADVSMSRSYVAAPVIVQDRVIGFVHCDYLAQRKIVGPMDADALWMFAEAFGFAFERIAYGERIGRLRTSFLQSMALAEDTFAHAVEDEISFDDGVTPGGTAGPVVPRAPAPAPSLAGGRSALADLLTRRELEVLRLMASGATNDGIASRLVISHGTAKTHVKHILRKLQAANRAEAVSRFFQLEHGGGAPGA